MFTRPIPALLHLALYASFVITQIELIEILVDGLSGSHRFFQTSLGGFYTFMISFIEVLSVLAFVATVAFLARRNMLKLPRLTMRELAGWPKQDANLILVFELILIGFIFTMNGADEVLQSDAGNSNGFAISSWLGPILFEGKSTHTLHELPALFQTPAYFHGFSKYLLFQIGSKRSVYEYAECHQ
jgi:hypothetical protein